MNASPRNLRLGFAGTPPFAVPALDALLRSDHRVEAVFTQPDRAAGRGRSLQASAVKLRALAAGLTVHQPPTFKSADVLELLRSLELDALVVVAYGQILPAAVLSTPALGCFNIHASLLPRWRGAAPIQRALMAGDAETGVTIMRMEAGLDTGPLLRVERTRIAAGDTAGSLHDRLASLGARLIVRALDEVAAGRARETAQPAEGVTYASKLTKAEASIDWQEDAGRILRRIRAFNPWPVAETRFGGAQLRIWDAELPGDPPRGAAAGDGMPVQALPGAVPAAPPEAEPAVAPASLPAAPPGSVLAASAAGIDVACGHGTLRVTRLQLAGRKPLAARDFLRAQPLDGARFAG